LGYRWTKAAKDVFDIVTDFFHKIRDDLLEILKIVRNIVYPIFPGGNFWDL
jgi:hypothetical protein